MKVHSTEGGAGKFSNTTHRRLPELQCKVKLRRVSLQEKVELSQHVGPLTKTPNDVLSIQ